MRIGTEETREDLTYNFLVSILPAPVKPEWQTQLRLAISEAAAAGAAQLRARSCARLAASANAEAVEVGRAIEVHGQAGLAKLGLGGARGASCPSVGDAQVVSLRIRNLTLPLAGTAALRAGSRRSGPASPSCACSPPTRCASAPPTPTATRCWRWTRPGR